MSAAATEIDTSGATTDSQHQSQEASDKETLDAALSSIEATRTAAQQSSDAAHSEETATANSAYTASADAAEATFDASLAANAM